MPEICGARKMLKYRQLAHETAVSLWSVSLTLSGFTERGYDRGRGED